MSNLLSFAIPTAPSIPDAAQRAQALDITRSFIVEAPAGSGKTELLTQRLLKLLASESVTDPAQVLAITFTRKSAHEMRDRVVGKLSAAARGDSPPNALAEAALENDRRHGWSLLDHPDRLNISTIDSLCSRIAGAVPVLSDSGGLAPTERATDLYTAAARRTLTLLAGEREADAPVAQALQTLLLHRDNNLADCESLIAQMLPWREQSANLIPLSSEQLTDDYLEAVTRPRLEKALQQAICRALTRLDRLMPPDLCEELSTLARSMSHSPGYNGADNPLAICRQLALHPGTAAESLDHWKLLARLLLTKGGEWRSAFNKNHVEFEIEKHHKAELRSLVDRLRDRQALQEALCDLTNLPPLRYPNDQWLVAKALFRVLARALVELRLVFSERAESDFTESSLVARQILRSGSALEDLFQSTGARLEHLLVDEMQDTSNAQYDLIRGLTQSWDGHSQTVFLVGDPKQSIYSFRQAQVARFLYTLHSGRLGELPLTPLHLTANFRSQKNLVDSFNETFSALFPDPAEAAESDSVTYRPAKAARPRTEGPHLVWHTTVIPYDSEDKLTEHALQTQRNAREIRALVDAWRARPLPPDRTAPWKIAILGRNRRHLHEVTKAFEPGTYQAVEIVPLKQRQEILDLLALTRALLHPADRTAWLALLRTPWCGLTLADLHLLAGQSDRSQRNRALFDLIRERGELLSEDGISRLCPFWTVMEAAILSRGRLPLSRRVERTWRAFAANDFLDESERANATRFFELLEDLEETAAEPISIGTLDQRLEKLYAASPENDVQMMTIHGAKGLEWDFVVVPQLESGSGRPESRLLNWIALEDRDEDEEDKDTVAHGIIAPVQPRGAESHALNRWIRSLDTARDAAERKRLFYVACTRAREELHLFAAPERSASGEIKPRYDSVLRSAWPAAEPWFAERKEMEPGIVATLAAAPVAVPPSPIRTIQRVPLSLFPITNLGAPGLDSEVWGEAARSSPAAQTNSRPEGSFEARALGNATHTFLELLTQRIAAGQSFASLAAELPTWSPRIQTLLRSASLAQESIPTASATIVRSLTRTIKDENGRWLIDAHPEALTESSLSAPTETIRLDRIFLAGPEPLTPGTTHLWIVDYKTGFHAAEGLESFLSKQRELYAPQLETYAAHLASRGLPIRLALYYPTLPALLWWPHRP